MRKTGTIWKMLLLLLGSFTVSTTAMAALSGTYTINATLPASATNYVTVSAAISDLMSGTRADGGTINGPGVSGPVTLRIAAGTGPYIEQVSIGAIAGTSATNYVRLTGGPTRETIQFANTTTTDRHVVRLSGTKNIILDSLTLVNTGVTYGYGVWITANSDSNFVQNSMIYVSTTTTSSSFAGITISGTTPTTTGNNGDYNTVQGNVVSGGYYGYSCNGTSTTVFSESNHVLNNEFRDFYYYGIRHYEQNGATIAGNIVHARPTGTTAGYGMYIYYNDRFTIERNHVYDVGNYGMYFYSANYQGGASSSRATVRNNFIGGTMLNTTSPSGIYATTNSTNIDFFHNSVSLTGGNGRCLYILAGSGHDVRNNSFSITNSTTGYAAYVTTATFVSTMNYNNYYAPGSSNFVYVGVAYTPATYIGGGGFNVNSRDGDPNYLSATTDLHAYAAQLFDAGDPTVVVSNDFDGEVRPHPVSSIPDIGGDEYLPDSVDIGTTTLIEPTDYICPDSQQVVRVIIANKGLNTQSNIPVFVNITGPTTATISTTYPGPLALGESDTVTVGTFNSWPGGAFNVEAYTAVLNDQSRDNDTLSVTRYINVTPAAPTVVGDTICAGDSTALAAVATGSNYWYDSPIGGTLLQSGDTLNTGPLVSAATYYVESRGTATNSLTTTFANNNSCGGGNMFDVTAIATVTIDSFDLHLQNPGTTSLTEVYYKVGGYTGFETTPGAWTLLGSTNVTSLGTGVATRLVLPSTLTIPAGQTYAIYVFNANVVYTSLGATYTSPEMSITTGVGLCSLFGGTNNPRTWNGRVYYHAEGCASPRTEVSVAVNPAPIVSLADTSGCDQVTLDAGNAGMGYSYNWSTSATTQTIAVTASGTYEVTVSTGLCDAIDASVVTIDPTPVVALGSDMTLCDGGSTVLDAGNAGANFLWNTGDSTQTITVSTAGTYAVGVTSALGCAGADTITIATENSTAGTVSVDTSGCPTVLFTGTSTGGTPDVITWNFGDGGTGTGSNPSHVYTANGVYTVMYVQENECGSDTVTALVTIDCLVGVTAPNGTQVALYPNPTSGLAALAITMPAMGEATIMVTDLHGKIVLQQRQQLDAGSVVLPVDLRAMSAGIYVVHVVTDGLRWQARLVKQ